jgi:hypothetical protein
MIKMTEEFNELLERALKERQKEMSETRELTLIKIGELARLLPEQRIGQIIFNYICSYCPNNDPFFIEDKQLLAILERVASELE